MPRTKRTKNARRTSTRRNPKKAGFPYRVSDNKALEEGEQVERARYFGGIRSFAEQIAKEARGDDDRIQELIAEAADSAVTYTRDAWKIAWNSDRSDAIEDVLGDDPAEWGASGVTDVITKIAFFAYEQDLREQVEAVRGDYEDED